MRKGFLLCCLLVLLALTTAEAQERWSLELKPVKMDRVLVTSPAGTTAYWYLVYRINNPMDVSVPLSLFIRAHSDVGKKSYVEWYSAEALKIVAAKEGRPLKGVQEMRGEIGPGETLEAVALFRNVHEGTDLLKIEVRGLWDRVYTEKDKLIVEDKILNLYYYKPGDEYYPQFDRFYFKKHEWVVLNRRERAR